MVLLIIISPFSNALLPLSSSSDLESGFLKGEKSLLLQRFITVLSRYGKYITVLSRYGKYITVLSRGQVARSPDKLSTGQRIMQPL